MLIAEKPDIRIPELRKRFFEELYEEVFPAVAIFVSHRKGSLQDAKDVFHDALIILYEKTMENTLPEDASPERYLVGIAKHVWIRKFNREKHSVSLDAMESSINLPNDYFPEADSQKLLAFLERTGERCLEMLRSLYYDKVSITKVASQFGYQSTHSASVQKFKCLEKMRDTIKEKSMNYEDFLE